MYHAQKQKTLLGQRCLSLWFGGVNTQGSHLSEGDLHLVQGPREVALSCPHFFFLFLPHQNNVRRLMALAVFRNGRLGTRC